MLIQIKIKHRFSQPLNVKMMNLFSLESSCLERSWLGCAGYNRNVCDSAVVHGWIISILTTITVAGVFDLAVQEGFAIGGWQTAGLLSGVVFILITALTVEKIM